jgi:hypothetical protein
MENDEEGFITSCFFFFLVPYHLHLQIWAGDSFHDLIFNLTLSNAFITENIELQKFPG